MPIPSMLSVKLREPLTVHIEHASVAEHWTDIQDHKWFLSASASAATWERRLPHSITSKTFIRPILVPALCGA
jgi:hypothetical protein